MAARRESEAGKAVNDRLAIGVYVCHCGTNVAGALDVRAVCEAAATLDGVVVARECRFLCARDGQELIRRDIREAGVGRVVVAACSPWLHETTFRGACAAAGLNPFNLQMANIREHVAWVTRDRAAATHKAIAAVTAATRRIVHQRPLSPRRVPMTRRVLVVGAGIAGVEASLRLADAGIPVVLVEREPSIGGHMAKLDRTFPALECSACVLVPKLAAVVEHPRITLLSCSEIENVEGAVGSFRARVRRRPRYVDASRCTGCGACLESCPSRDVPSEFDQGLSLRTAIHFPHAQAVPHVPLIDRAACYHFDGTGCEVCRRACSADAVDLDQADEALEIDAGAVILATGFRPFDARPATQYGYGRWDNVITSLEFERLCHPSGPTGGRIVLKSGRSPESIAILHCVGSRDVRFNRHCSRVCCSAALKTAWAAREKTGARVYNFFIDIRGSGKEFEEFYERVQRAGVVFVHGKGTEVISRGGKLLVKAEDTLLGRRAIVPVDMVVLMVGMEATSGAAALGRAFGVTCSRDGFFMERHAKLMPGDSTTPGIFLAGTCQGPKDIADSVAQGAAAAAAAWALVARDSVDLAPHVATISAGSCSGCALCIGECGNGAIALERTDGRSVARVDEARCSGCGACVAACPAGAIDQPGFTRIQLDAEIRGLLA